MIFHIFRTEQQKERQLMETRRWKIIFAWKPCICRSSGHVVWLGKVARRNKRTTYIKWEYRLVPEVISRKLLDIDEEIEE